MTPERLRDFLNYDPETGVFHWRVHSGRVAAGDVAGNLHPDGHWRIRVAGRRYPGARLAWFWMTGEWPAGQVGYKNSDPTDLRWANLREVDASTKMMSKVIPRTNRSGVKGVFWLSRRSRWLAYITLDRHRIDLGKYENFADAVAARKAGERKYHGEFARAA